MVAAAVCSHGEALAQRRVALVIGSNDYAKVPKLERAVNDANAVAATFGELGFHVISLLDPTRSQFSQALAEFEARVQPGDIAAFFFAGHGVSLDGGNYLLPIDVPNVSDGQKNRLKNEGFLADEIADRLKDRGAATTVMILDACRNNPFRDTAGRSIGGSRGLARMDTRPGMFVMFSAGTGQVALDRLGADDTDPNSIFTRHLIRVIKRPDLSLIDVAKELQIEVPRLAATVRHDQLPAYYDQVQGRVFLARRAGTADASPPPSAAPLPAPSHAATAFWQARQVGTCGAYEAFARAFPGTFEATLADEHIKANCRPSVALPAITSSDGPRATTPPPSRTRLVRINDNISQGILNVRTGPGTGYPLVIAIPAGVADVEVGRCRSAEDGSRFPWCEVRWRGSRGWASSCCWRDAQ